MLAEFSISRSRESNRKDAFSWVVSHVRPQWLQIISLLIGAFANAFLAACIPLLLKMAYQAVSTQPIQEEKLRNAALLLIGSQLLRAVLQLTRNFSAEVIGQRLERDIRDEFYISLLGKSMAFHDSQPVGDTMARATNDVREINLMLNPGINLVVGSGMFLLMPPIIAFRLHPSLTLLPLLFVVLYLFAVRAHLRRLRPISEEVRSSFGSMNSQLAEAIDGVETVKGFAQEAAETERFSQRALAVRSASVAQGLLEARYIPLLLLGITGALGFAHSIWLYQQGALQVGDIVAYAGLLALFGFPVNISLNAYTQVSLGMAGARRVLELINRITHMDENAIGYAGELRGEIAFDDVSFGYHAGAHSLRNVSFSVPAGQTVAIVGQTGAGKTSLAKLVNRTYDTIGGRVLVDGVDVRDWNLAALRRQISIIEQDIFLFSRSIADNIAFGVGNATREQIEWAAKEAQAHEFILGFEKGYDTLIGERGVTLSGGQRQRLALARAFLTNPRVLILDDSTSAIDSATEDQIQRAIFRASKRQTTLLITHRLSQIRWADKIVVLRNGQVDAVGSHQEMLEKSSAYRELFQQTLGG